MAEPEPNPLYLRFLGSLIEELGSKMYPSVTASVAELVSNAWDADAKNVWITMPLGKSIQEGMGDEVIVTDDGVGMTREEAQSKYLIVGRKRRLVDQNWRTPAGRPLHGRKGIGKLAAFGTAKSLECITKKEGGDGTAFLLEYSRIRELEAGVDYKVPELHDRTLKKPGSNSELDHGTRVRLFDLLSKRIPSESQFKNSLSRRFGVLSPAMRVFLNGEELQRFNIPVDIRFPRDDVPVVGKGLPKEDPETCEPQKEVVIEDDWAVESLLQGEVRWWIGFTPTPIDAAELRGISVLAHEKMVQRPFMFGRSQGTSGQLGQEYLVGEVVANWIDNSVESDEDLVETNRDELQLEDQRLQSFLKWGQKRLRWALARRNEIRTKKVLDEVQLNENIKSRLLDFTDTEQRTFKKIASQLASIPEVSEAHFSGLMLELMDSHDDKSVREMIEQIGNEEEETQSRMWALVSEFGLIDARRTATKIQARIEVIQKLEEMVSHGATEVPEIHNHVLANPWLLDPRWDLYAHEANLTKMLRKKHGYTTESASSFADYLFAMGPSTPTTADEVIVVEIKRGTNKDGTKRVANLQEVQNFARYVTEADQYFKKSNSTVNQPAVKGLMIADGYTQDAQNQRIAFEQVPGHQYQFKSWSSVLKDTKRLHLGWLKLSSLRSKTT